MTIYLYCLFGPESALMPYFLRHYAGQVDRLFMLDGGSDFETREIVRSCPSATIEDSPFIRGGYDEYAFVDYLAVKCREARGKADWALAVDADEFLYHPTGLRNALDACRRTHIRAVQAEGFQMVADSFPEGDGQLTEIVRLGTRDPEYDKLAAFDPNVDVIWSPGRHNFRSNAIAHQPGIRLLHYRYFGPDYLAARNAVNFARRSPADIAAGRGYHGAPDHKGKYSAGWWVQAARLAKDVTG